MTLHKFAIALTAANFILLLVLLTQALSAKAEGPMILRGSALEIVDAHGRVRASIGILSTPNSSEETVLLRLINAKGQPSVKIATAPQSAGLSFVGGDDESYLILQADGAKTLLKMVEPNKPERVLTPE